MDSLESMMAVEGRVGLPGPLRKLLGNLIVLGSARGQRRAARRPAEAWRRDRDERLSRTVRYAARTVPHYRRLFADLGVAPERIRTAPDLARLPLLDKATVRRDPDRFVSRSWRGRTSVPFMTTGSTGAPLRIHHDVPSILATAGNADRMREYWSVRDGRRPRILSFGVDRNMLSKVLEIVRHWTWTPARGSVRKELRLRPSFEEAIEAIDRFRPDVVTGYGSYLETLFQIVATEGVSVHVPDRIVYYSDAMTEPGRRLIERELGVHVHSIYTAAEAFLIGSTCEEGGGFHLHADLCHLRVVDEAGVDLPPGERGEIVISNLVNRGTVLLNYRLGDLGVLSPEPCSCGRTFPVLRELSGRTADYLLLPDGRKLHSYAVWPILGQEPAFLQFQLVQHRPDNYTLRIAPRPGADVQTVVADVIPRLREVLGDARVEVEFGEPPFTGPGEKRRSVVSLISDS